MIESIGLPFFHPAPHLAPLPNPLNDMEDLQLDDYQMEGQAAPAAAPQLNAVIQPVLFPAMQIALIAQFLLPPAAAAPAQEEDFFIQIRQTRRE